MEINQYFVRPQTDTEDDHPILRKEMEAAVQSLKKGKSDEVDSIPAELVQAGGEAAVTALLTICDKIWHRNSQERQPAAVPELPIDQPHQQSEQSHAEDHTEQNEAESRNKHHRKDLQP